MERLRGYKLYQQRFTELSIGIDEKVDNLLLLTIDVVTLGAFTHESAMENNFGLIHWLGRCALSISYSNLVSTYRILCWIL